MYFCRRLLLQCVEVAEPSDISCDSPVVEFAGRFVQLLVLQHRADDVLFKPSQQGFNQLASCCGLSIDMEDVGGTPQAVAFGEPRDHAVVQQFDPFDGSVDTVAVADGETRETLVFLIPWGYLFPGLLLELLEPLVKVSNGLCILLLFLMMDSVLLSNGLYERLGEVAESDWVVDVKALNDVSH